MTRMKIAIKANTLSDRDSQRLEKSFFLPSLHLKDEKKSPKKNLLFILCAFLIFGFCAVFLAHNFGIVILPRSGSLNPSGMVDLLAEKKSLELELFNPQGGTKILKNFIYLELPPNKKTGFILNFKEKIDMSQTTLVLLVKNPGQDFKMDAVLRDIRFYSNAQTPLTIEVVPKTQKSTYCKIPVQIGNRINSHLSLSRINQIRFTFYQQRDRTLPLFVKNVFWKKGGNHE